MQSKVPLSKYADIIMGQSPKGDTCSDDIIGLPLLNGPTEFGSKYPVPTQFTTDPKKICKVNDILFCVRGSTTGRMNYADQVYAIGRGIASIRGKNGCPTVFVRGLIERNLQQLLNIATGSTFPNVSREMINSFEVENVSKENAIKIAHILSTLDDKIELNRKMNETLEAMAQALFKSWFVDFDPVIAKAKAKSEQELEVFASTLGISKEILDLFPSEFEESEMGMIPKGWELVKIEKILKRYRAPKRYKKDAVEKYGKTMVLEQGADIILGYHNDDGEFEATPDEPMFIFGDHTCVMRLSTKPFSISENVIPLSGSIRNGYWSYYATYGQQSFQEYRRHWAELIVRNIVLAPIKVCDYFAKKVQPLILKIEQNRLENNELIMTRDTLLPKLLSGELDVSNIHIGLENEA